VITIDVLGTPAPKGSNRAISIGGRARFVPGGSRVNQANLRSWDVAVREAALLAVRDAADRARDGGVTVAGDAPCYVEQPLEVVIEFRMARPGGHWGKRGLRSSAPIAPATKPDIDKLARSTLDSLTGLVFDDDSRIVELRTRKIYATPGCEGATINVRKWVGP